LGIQEARVGEDGPNELPPQLKMSYAFRLDCGSGIDGIEKLSRIEPLGFFLGTEPAQQAKPLQSDTSELTKQSQFSQTPFAERIQSHSKEQPAADSETPTAGWRYRSVSRPR